MNESDYSLDPSRFPRRLELNLSAELHSQLQELARRSGRSIDEIILQQLDRSLRADNHQQP
jgi:predicted HicB family RNase H-like nuclease